MSHTWPPEEHRLVMARAIKDFQRSLRLMARAQCRSVKIEDRTPPATCHQFPCALPRPPLHSPTDSHHTSPPAHAAQSMPETGIKCTTCGGTALANHQAIRTIASAAKPSPTPESNRFGRGGGRVQVPLSRVRFTGADRARCAINAGNRHQMHNV